MDDECFIERTFSPHAFGAVLAHLDEVYNC
jgi:hypothetical protein